MSRTMTLSIENFGGIEAAAMDINPGLTLLTGANGAGKTTVLRALAACIRSDTVMPILLGDGKEALLKKESHLLVRGKSGSVTLTGEQGMRRVTWPANTAKGTGPFPGQVAPSRMALGLIDWMAIPQAARIKVLQETAAKDPSLSAVISREDLDRAVAGNRLDQGMIDWAWQVISNNGFDVAHSEAAKHMSESTGGWRATTKETFGEEKCKAYLPQGWEADLVSATQEGLQQEIQAKRQAVDLAIANQAVDAAEVARVETLAGTPLPDIAGLEASLATARTTRATEIANMQRLLAQWQQEPQEIIDARVAVTANNNRIKAIRGEIAVMRSGALRIDGHCPGCGIPVAVQDFGPGHAPTRYGLSFLDGTQVDQAQIDALESENARLAAATQQHNISIANHARSATEQVTRIREELNREQSAQKQAVQVAENNLHAAKRQVGEITAAQSQLAAIRAKGGGASAAEIATLRQSLSRSETRLRAWEVKQSADRYAEDARQFAVLKEVTAPGGLRKTKMDTALAGLNARCAELSSIAHWGPVSLTADSDLQYAGRPYVICSAAEQYRCRVTMQVLLASLEQPPILLVDGTDILDSAGRMGLVNLLRSTGITTVIAMTARQDYAQGVARLFDAAFWVEGGQVTQIPTTGQQ
ncbi:MAG: AAA family ATPase [Magnetococcus sp. YQC-3]